VRPPAVVLVGRQNVGKSTLANRLAGAREAIAHETPGVTRDRVELTVAWRGRTFRLIDTGGFVERARGLDAAVVRQADRAAAEADVILLVVDAQTGPVEDDAVLARRLRGARGPVLVVANKVDSEREEPDALRFLSLGLGEPVPVSGLAGRGSGDLLDRIVALLPPEGAEGEAAEEEPRFALVGRPNVGKSSLFNRLVGDERSVVFEEAGTTRDAVDAVVEWPTRRVRFVDTAGLRRPVRTSGVEYYSLLRAERAIERAGVSLLVLDATQGLTGEDKRIAARVIETGRGLVAVLNKWDLVREKDRTFKEMGALLSSFVRAPVLRTSAKTGTGVQRLPPALLEVHDRWSHRAPTAEVNAILQAAQADRPGPVRYRYGTQIRSRPPTFVLFGGRTPEAPYRRFLTNRLRVALGLDGVPVKLVFRAGGGRDGGRPEGAARRGR
jgi:GTPase